MSAPTQNLSASRRLSRVPLPLANASLAKTVAAIFLLSAAIQLLAGWLFLFRADVSLLDFDEREYWTLSGQILAGMPMEVGRRTFFHPFLLAGLRSLSDNVWFVQSCVAILGATAPPLLALLVAKLTRSQVAAIVAGIAFALWPPQVFYASSLYSETIALPVFLAFLLLLPIDARGERRPMLWQWLFAGAMLGITAHIRPMYQLFLPILPLILWLDTRRLALAAGRFVLVAAGFAAVVLPWSIYVSRELGQPVLLSANGGETLAGGFNEQLIEKGDRHATLPKRTLWFGPGKWVPVPDTGYLTANEQKLPYVEQDKLLRQRTVSWIHEDPASASYLAARKLAYMWGIYPFAGNGWRQALLGNVPTLILMLLFLFSVATLPQVRRRCSRLYMLPVFVTGVGLISWGSWRFRLPADAGMIGVVAVLVTVRMRSRFSASPARLEL